MTTSSKNSKPSRMLAPAAYSEAALPSLKLARSSRIARGIGKLLFALLVLGVILIAFAPWQQSVKGQGTVMAYAPLEREQTIESPIEGRIVRLGDGIYENAHVRKGDLIAEVADIDPDYFKRLEGQLAAAQRRVEFAKLQLEADQRYLNTAEKVVLTVQDRLKAYKQVKDHVVAAAEATIRSSEDKVDAEKQNLAEQEATLVQVQADYDRVKILHEEKFTSTLKFQEAERKLKHAQAKVAQAKSYISAAENDLASKRADRKAKEQKAQADIDYAGAELGKAEAEVSKAESVVSKAQGELTKADKELLEMQTKVERQRSQSIPAPFDGFVRQITPNQGTKILKKGDPICVIIPDTKDRAVELWLDGNDAPLVEPGRHVRLQFEGWPAVQFAGWPSVAVGTFGGEVISVDATDDGNGKFRVLILPDESEHEWPNERFLRQGVRAKGWVLLERVPLWYEIWRNMNGFPPVVSTEEPKDSGKPPKPPKP